MKLVERSDYEPTFMEKARMNGWFSPDPQLLFPSLALGAIVIVWLALSRGWVGY